MQAEQGGASLELWVQQSQHYPDVGTDEIEKIWSIPSDSRCTTYGVALEAYARELASSRDAGSAQRQAKRGRRVRNRSELEVATMLLNLSPDVINSPNGSHELVRGAVGNALGLENSKVIEWLDEEEELLTLGKWVGSGFSYGRTLVN